MNLAPQPKPAREIRTRSTGGIPVRVVGQNLVALLTDDERTAARNLYEQMVANATEPWTQHKTEVAIIEPHGNIPSEI